MEKHDLETQATIERERITSAAVKQLKAEIKDEKSKHEEQVNPRCLHNVHWHMHKQHKQASADRMLSCTPLAPAHFQPLHLT